MSSWVSPLESGDELLGAHGNLFPRVARNALSRKKKGGIALATSYNSTRKQNNNKRFAAKAYRGTAGTVPSSLREKAKNVVGERNG